MILLILKEDKSISIFDSTDEELIGHIKNAYTVLPSETLVPNTPQYTWRWNAEENYIYTDMSIYNSAKWEEVRTERNKLLTESDILVTRALEDGTDMKPIRQYRQALREITTQPDPFNITWPVL